MTIYGVNSKDSSSNIAWIIDGNSMMIEYGITFSFIHMRLIKDNPAKLITEEETQKITWKKYQIRRKPEEKSIDM